jgi:hypothetical protein
MRLEQLPKVGQCLHRARLLVLAGRVQRQGREQLELEPLPKQEGRVRVLLAVLALLLAVLVPMPGRLLAVLGRLLVLPKAARLLVVPMLARLVPLVVPLVVPMRPELVAWEGQRREALHRKRQGHRERQQGMLSQLR